MSAEQTAGAAEVQKILDAANDVIGRRRLSRWQLVTLLSCLADSHSECPINAMSALAEAQRTIAAVALKPIKEERHEH